MTDPTEFLATYLDIAKEDLDQFNRRFATEVPVSGRRFVEEVLGAFAASLDVLEITRQGLDERLARQDDSHEPSVRTEIVTVLDREGVIQFASASITPELGYAGSALVGRSLLDLIHPDDLPKVRQTLDPSLIRPGSTVRFHSRMLHLDRSWRWAVSRGRSIRSAEQTWSCPASVDGLPLGNQAAASVV